MTLSLRGLTVGQKIVPPLIVGEIKTKRLQPRFKIPIHFGQKEKIRIGAFDGRVALPQNSVGIASSGLGKAAQVLVNTSLRIKMEDGQFHNECHHNGGRRISNLLTPPGAWLNSGSRVGRCRSTTERKGLCHGPASGLRYASLVENPRRLGQALNQELWPFQNPAMVESDVVCHEIQNQFRTVDLEFLTKKS